VGFSPPIIIAKKNKKNSTTNEHKPVLSYVEGLSQIYSLAKNAPSAFQADLAAIKRRGGCTLLFGAKSSSIINNR